MAGALELAFHLAAFLLLAVLGGIACWIWVMGTRRQRLLPLPRRATGEWSGHEVFLVFVLFSTIVPPLVLFLFQNSGFYEHIYDKVPSLHRQQLWVWILVTPLTVAVVFLTLFLMSRTRPSAYGMSLVRLAPNLTAGYLCWLVVTPLVLGVFFLLMPWIPAEEHPLAELGKQDLLPVEWALVIFQAVLAAPLLEELVFRGVLLGWMQRATWQGHCVVAAVALLFAGLSGLPSPTKGTEEQEFFWDPLLFVLFLLPFYLGPVLRVAYLIKSAPPPMAPPVVPVTETSTEQSPNDNPTGHSPEAETEEYRFWNVVGPICGSSLLFAAFHSGVWPSPIPLFLLALALGWLAYRTHSLVGPIVAHVLFNGVASIVMVLSAVYPDDTNGKAATSADRPSLSGSTVTPVPGSQLPRRR